MKNLQHFTKRRITISLVLFSSIFYIISLVSCKHKPIEPVKFVCFESEVLPIFVSNCTQSGCHDKITAAEGYTLDSYSGIMKGIKAWNANRSINYQVLLDGSMPIPPRQALTAAQLQIIKDWINGGAENSTGCDTASCDTSAAVTYSNQVVTIMNKYCVGCHSGNPPLGNIDLTTYANVKNQITLGRFWGSINWDAGFSAMPKGGKQISACELSQIKKWLDNGSPNN